MDFKTGQNILPLSFVSSCKWKDILTPPLPKEHILQYVPDSLSNYPAGSCRWESTQMSLNLHPKTFADSVLSSAAQSAIQGSKQYQMKKLAT